MVIYVVSAHPIKFKYHYLFLGIIQLYLQKKSNSNGLFYYRKTSKSENWSVYKHQLCRFTKKMCHRSKGLMMNMPFFM